MDKAFSTLDWSLIEAFLAVAEGGSLSAAARTMQASQPTLGRQIKSIEAQLGADLFRRVPRGLELTDTGAALVAPARAMRDAARQIALAAAGRQESLAGTVRITASVAMSVYHLPAIIGRMRRDIPEVEIELVPSDESRNLLFREADIAVRMYRPTQSDLIAKYLGDIVFAAYASRDYLARRGLPGDPAGLLEHDFVGYDQTPDIIEGMQAAGLPVDRRFFALRCDDNIAYWELVRAGCGIGFAQRTVGHADPDMVEIDIGFPLPTLPVWLTAHETMRRTPRIRKVWDMLADGMRPLVT